MIEFYHSRPKTTSKTTFDEIIPTVIARVLNKTPTRTTNPSLFTTHFRSTTKKISTYRKFNTNMFEGIIY